jgi:hypothetical protein
MSTAETGPVAATLPSCPSDMVRHVADEGGFD